MGDESKSENLEGLRKRAKHWLKALRSGDAEARARLQRVLGRAPESPGLRQVQQALARERGFESWAALKEAIELDRLTTGPEQALVDEFLRRACLSYGRDDFPSKWRSAERMLRRRPELATADLFTAVVSGELDYVKDALRREPELASRPGGPQGWQPLLFLCYGRLPTERAVQNAVAIAELLLDAGADADARWIGRGDSDYQFTALTGAIGGGELGQPEHPRAEALAELLLARGADPGDSQALYDTHLEGDDTRWLELLARHGLSAQHRVNWVKGDAPSNFDYLTPQAVKHGHLGRLRWLLEHGADPNARSTYTGKTCYELALMAGRQDALELLLEHGARPVELDGHVAFVAAAARGDELEARRLVAEHPEYLTDLRPLLEAASAGNAAMVRLLLVLGVDPNGEGPHGHRALNDGCNHREVVEALWEYGADPVARCFGGTPAGWSLHGGNLEMARRHAERGRSILDAVMCGHVELVRELLQEEAARVGERAPWGDTPLHGLPADVAVAEAIARLLLAHGADAGARNDAGKTAAEALEDRGLDEVADVLQSLLA